VKLVALIAAALTAALVSLDAQQGRLMLAVMRRDGVMIPFAAFDGRNWSTPWPPTLIRTVRPLELIELPIALDDVPEAWWGGPRPTQWKLWPQEFEGEPVSITPGAPLVVFGGRARRLGLRTNHAPSGPAVAPFELPFPKDGVVVAGDATLAPVASVSRHTAQWKGLTTELRADIDRAERKTIDGIKRQSQWVHPIPEWERGAVVADLEAWYTSNLAQPGYTVSYIEAVKKYPPAPEDEDCGLETFVRGWVHHNTRTSVKVTELTAKVTYCDREGVSYMLPFGQLAVQGRTHWIVQLSGWENEWLAVARFEPQRVRYVVEYMSGSRRPF
jgi:hypothetical protein